MLKISQRFWLATALLVVASSGWTQTREPVWVGQTTRNILILGNSDYRNLPPLKNPRNDAQLLANRFARLGYVVFHGQNFDSRATRKLVDEFVHNVERSPKDAVIIMFLAGHGVQLKGINYFLPVDADGKTEGLLTEAALNIPFLVFRLQRTEERSIILIIDACRNDPFRGRIAASGRGLAKMDARTLVLQRPGHTVPGPDQTDQPAGIGLAFSTQPGDVALDGEGANSPFAQALAELVDTPSIQFLEFFERLKQRTTQLTGGLQVPWISYTAVKDFRLLAR